LFLVEQQLKKERKKKRKKKKEMLPLTLEKIGPGL